MTQNSLESTAHEGLKNDRLWPNIRDLTHYHLIASISEFGWSQKREGAREKQSRTEESTKRA